MAKARLSGNLRIGDAEKAFLQIAVKENRDSFRFLYNVKGEKNDLRFTRVPCGVEASLLVFGVTLQYHLKQQELQFEDTLAALKENKYVDNLM